MKAKRITLGIVGIVLLGWCFLPDPLPILIDDVITGIGGAASILTLIVSFFKKDS